MSRSRIGAGLGLAALSLAVAAPVAVAEPLGQSQPGLLSSRDAASALETLALDDDGENGGYDREEFYKSWRVVTAAPEGVPNWYGWDSYTNPDNPWYQEDVANALEPETGCDAREITLIRDAVDGDVEWDAECEITSGTWYEDYASTETTDPGALDIEHLVAMQDAWNTGASEWSTDQRLAFSHDPLVLVAVADSENSSKGSDAPRLELTEDGEVPVNENGDPVYDEAPGGYLPANQDAWHDYAVRYISIKSNYDLALADEQVRGTLAVMLSLPDATPDGTSAPAVPVEESADDIEPAESETPAEEPAESESPAEEPAAPQTEDNEDQEPRRNDTRVGIASETSDDTLSPRSGLLSWITSTVDSIRNALN